MEKAAAIEGVYVPKFYSVRYEKIPLTPFSKGDVRIIRWNSSERGIGWSPEKIKRRYIKEISAHRFRSQ